MAPGNQEPMRSRERILTEVPDEQPPPERSPGERRGGTRILVVALLVAFVASAAINAFQHWALEATLSESRTLSESLEAASERADEAERAYTQLRGVVDDVNARISAVQQELGALAALTKPEVP